MTKPDLNSYMEGMNSPGGCSHLDPCLRTFGGNKEQRRGL